ncbi:RusA family crossover junction endodeoxyribonuclease [Acaricomes phytoseiuli]|uniref:RusA family crossover junction endodeoxyribonuclease n=1 Tax=Acaricomes phytoseiuli TaxID=291968 RepID=UPI003872AC17
MEPLIIFAVYGEPAPQGSKGRGRYGNLYEMSRHLPAWRAQVTQAAQAIQGPLWEPLDRPIVVRAEFYLPRPASTKFTNHPAGPPDLDKLFRAVGDSLTKAETITDDSRIVRWLGTKHWAIGRDPGAEITIYEMSRQ